VAWACFTQRQNYRNLVSMGESTGIPLALLLKAAPRRRPRHLMIGHYLSSRKKLAFFDLLRIQKQIDVFLCHSPFQAAFVKKRWAVASSRVVQLYGAVDTEFFSARNVGSAATARTGRPLIVSAGAEARDYKTLVEAVDGVSADVVIRAASPWVKNEVVLDRQSLPPGVAIMDEAMSYRDLRQLYAQADCVVVPLAAVEYAAGLTTVIEAMALGKPVVCTATPGRDGALVDGETGLLAKPHSAESLRAAICQALENSSAARSMGECARERVVSVASLDAFVDAVRTQLDLEQAQPHP